ncbi:hypothetical protein AHFPHNDE_03007 [Pseudomonas sp. MM227]|uniref:DUF2269 family protein n=1 Tax=unclassified Pseudomonas TaxID=196821 RepID=UPI000F011B9B|nr:MULTISPECIES: DUF2269 family protein [unclassified Pseudomonas]MBD8733501.1 DUF2269 family protein [Pseudomonas sp. CFBP 13710]CAI3789312.1 hypothetical protein AHFPHNDE_03007 [Pseudomonas sp. MM227]
MSADSVFQTLHGLAVLMWLGGMLATWTILRPAGLAVPSRVQRLQRLVDIFPRLFGGVWAAVLILPISGVALLRLRFTGFETAPRDVQIMMGLYVVMVALFLRMQGLQLPALRKAVAAQAWADGAIAVKQLRRLAVGGLLLGLATVVLGMARQF